jgi:3-isopropylmalate/(R)-2-methylmalate dehydratase small subunit
MDTSQIVTVRGRAVPVRGSDIDTDRIIPARYLRTVTFADLGAHAFEDDRAAGGHPFDDPRYQGAAVLVANANFGCGSSREHAPQALRRWGIRGFVAESFAEIFFGNCLANGLPCVVASPADVGRLQSAVEAQPGIEVGIDLGSMVLTCGGHSFEVTMPGGPRQALVSGSWDSLGQLLEAGPQVDATAARLPYMRCFVEA